MICFRDMSFCSASDHCLTTDCPRHFGEDDKKAAEKWWGGPDAPIAIMDFQTGCKEYKRDEHYKGAKPKRSSS